MARANGVETRTRIVDTAIRLFAAGGTGATGMRELAEASDLTLPGLYYHFKSKQELVKAIFDQRAARLRNSHPPKDGTSVRQRVRQQATGDFAEMKDDDFMRLLVLESISGGSEAVEALTGTREAWDARWAKTLSGASDLAPDVDATSAARVVTTALLGIYLQYLCGLNRSVKELIEDLADTTSAALTKTP